MAAVNTTITRAKFWTVEAECTDESGQAVIRHAGIVRGMTDNGQPGWTKSPDRLTREEAFILARVPYDLSVYDGAYRGGAVRVIEHNLTTVTVVEDAIREVWA